MPPFRFVTYCAVPFRIKTAAAISAHPLFKRICTKTIDRNVYSFGKALCGALPIRAAPIRQSSSDRPLDLSYDCSYWNSRIESTLEQDACDLFAVIDTDADNRVSREEFVWGLTSAPNVDLFEIEAGRLFDSIDTEEAGFVDRSQFIMAAMKLRWLRSLIRLFKAGFNYDFSFTIKPDYDYDKTSAENYKSEGNLFVGPYAHIRRTRNYDFHNNYTVERQQWQDAAVRASISKTDPQARPWMIFTCGAFGVGKGHVLSWLSGQGLFPLEYIVHVDPDFFKRVMPEWKGYLRHNQDFAGSATHPESIYMQEIAAEAALEERQHVWIDGSLRNYEYYSKFIKGIKKHYRHYRIAILYITASDEVVRARIQQRAEETGRYIPESEIIKSLRSPEISVQKLAPLCDLVVRFNNDGGTPRLLSVEDHSGNLHKGLNRHFGVITRQHLQFPDGYGPKFLENTALRGEPFILTGETGNNHRGSYPSYKGDLLVKESASSPWTPCVVEMSKRVITCTPASRPFGRPLTRYEITDRTVVRLHEESRHLSVSSVKVVSGSGGDESSENSVQADDDRLRYSFYVNKLDDKNNVSFLEFSTASDEIRTTWKELMITTKKEYIREQEIRIYGNDTHRLVKWKINRDSLSSSKNVSEMLSLTGLISMKSSTLLDRKITEDQQIGNVPDSATHFRWFHANAALQDIAANAKINVDDPDVAFLLEGGFAYYNKEGKFLGAMSTATRDTEYYMHFGEPMRLSPEDAERLNKAGRWVPTTKNTTRQAGAQFFTFINPNEQLAGAAFPPLGCFAFLFRRPFDPPDERDRYFPILPAE